MADAVTHDMQVNVATFSGQVSERRSITEIFEMNHYCYG